MNIGVYILGLDRHGERVATLAARLAADGIDFEFVAGFDGRNLEVTDFPRYDHDRAVRHMGRGLSGGEIGCYVGHENALRAFLSSPYIHGLILEDDAVPAENLLEHLAGVVESLNLADPEWRACNVGARHRKYASHVAKVLDRDVYAAHYYPMTSHGIVWTRKGAEEFLTRNATISMPVDNQMRHDFTRNAHGYAVAPPLVGTSLAPSLIEGAQTSRRKIRRDVFYGLRKKRRIVADKLFAIRGKLLFMLARRNRAG